MEASHTPGYSQTKHHNSSLLCRVKHKHVSSSCTRSRPTKLHRGCSSASSTVTTRTTPSHSYPGADKNGMDLESCPRLAHQQNGPAENGVQIVKRTARINNAQAGTPSARLQPYAHACAAQQYNSTPTATNGAPLSRWPSASWQKPDLPLHPWGCCVFGLLGKDTSNPNNAMRSRAGIYLGLDTSVHGHLVYHEDRDVVSTYAYVDAEPHIFPIKQMLWAGEPSPVDGATDPESWRRHAPRPLADVEDGPAAEFLSGKQILFDLPRTVYGAKYPHQWRMRCHAPVYSRTVDRVVGVKCMFHSYNGGDDSLPSDERHYHNQYIILPMSLPHGKNTRLPDTYIPTTTVRQALANTYPAYTTLADIALGSTILRKHLTIPKVLDSVVASCVRSCPRGNRILLPVRQVGMF